MVEPIVIRRDGLMARIRKGIYMIPVDHLPLSKVCDFALDDGHGNVIAVRPNPTITEWLRANGLDDDCMSDDWTYWYDLDGEEACFLFKDPKLAMMFKLIWA